MRLLIALLVTTSLSATPFNPDKPIESLQLKDGRIVRNVQIVSFGTTTVMARWDGGRGTISLSSLPDEIASSMAAFSPQVRPQQATPRQAQKRPLKEPPVPTDSQEAAKQTLSGEIYIATRGGKNRMLSGVKVFAFAKEALSRFDTNLRVDLPKPVAVSTTDRDGRFTLEVPLDQPVFVFSQTDRYIGSLNGGDGYEHYTWIVTEFPNVEQVVLSNGNLQTKNPRVAIDM